MRLVLVSVLAVVLVAAPAFADLASEVGELDVAITARLAAIDAASATSAERREAKKLAKGQTKLRGYTGANDVADLKTLAKAGKLLHASRTTDPGILAEVADVIEQLLMLVETEKGLAADAGALLANPRHRARIDALIAKIEAVVGKAIARIGTNPGQTLRLLVKAYTKSEKAGVKAQKFSMTGGGGGGGGLPPGLEVIVSVGIFVISNESSKNYYVSDFVITGSVVDDTGASVSTPSGASIRAIDPAMFDGLNNAIGRLNPGDPASWHDLYQYLNAFRFASGFTFPSWITGNVVVTLSRKNDGRSTYQVTIPLTNFPF